MNLTWMTSYEMFNVFYIFKIHLVILYEEEKIVVFYDKSFYPVRTKITLESCNQNMLLNRNFTCASGVTKMQLGSSTDHFGLKLAQLVVLPYLCPSSNVQ